MYCEKFVLVSDLDIVVVTQDDPFYTPVFFESFLARLDDSVNVQQIVCLQPFQESIPEQAKRAIRLYGPSGFLKQGISYIWRDLVDKIGLGKYSVGRVAEEHCVPVTDVQSVNDESFVRQIESMDIDVILSVSCPEILEENILSAPEWGCLNVHTAKLPQYRGMMPTFWALLNGDSEIGVTVHEMVEKLDAGRIAKQTTFKVDDLQSLHQVILRGKRKGSFLAAETLHELNSNGLKLTKMEGDGSYFSFPTGNDRRKLQSRGWRLL